MSRGSSTASGHLRCAIARGSAEWTPKRRASYEAAITTPRSLGSVPVATTTGRPRRSGRRRSSTDTKNASMSTCAIQRSTPSILGRSPARSPSRSDLRQVPELGQAEVVARRVAEGRVDSVGPLLGRVHELHPARLELLVGGPDVVSGEEDRAGKALRHQ